MSHTEHWLMPELSQSTLITVDKSAVEYYWKLSELTAQIHKIGVLYNQTVRAINSYHSIKTAQILLEKFASA